MGKGLLKVKRITFFILIFILSARHSFAAVTPPTATGPIPLSLEQAAQRLIDHSLAVRAAALSYESAQIQYDIAWNQFYLPAITLSGSSTYTQSVGAIPNTPAALSPSLRTKGYPSSAISLGLGSYTLFNFFKDRDSFDINKLNYEQSKLNYEQTIRSAKFQLINQYFQTKIAQEQLDATERSVMMAEAILELINSRKALGKATDEEQNSASVDLLNAKVAYSEQFKTVEQTNVQLNTTLNVPPDTKFKLTTAPPFSLVKLNDKTLFEIFKTQSPTAKSLEISVQSAEISAANAEKSRLPLPSLTFSGIVLSYSQGFGYNQPGTYNNSTSGTMDVSASLGVTIPIFGGNGLFNEKAVRLAYIGLESTELSYRSQMMNAEKDIITQIAIVKQLQDQIVSRRESVTKSSKVLDSFFKKATSASTDRLQLRDAIREARDSEIQYLKGLLELITTKNGLALTLGLDQLPGDKQ